MVGSSNAEALGNMKYPFIAIAPRSTLAQSGSIWLGPIYGSNRTVWHFNWVQTNDLCEIELLEIELLDHLLFVNRWLMFNWIVSDT